MKENTPGVVSNSLLVGAGKSRRLSAIRDKVQPQAITVERQARQFATALRPETQEVLLQAIQLVEQHLAKILNAYPPGKQNTFFKLKYGLKPESIRSLPMQQVFGVLKLNSSNIGQFRRIEKLDFKGKQHPNRTRT